MSINHEDSKPGKTPTEIYSPAELEEIRINSLNNELLNLFDDNSLSIAGIDSLLAKGADINTKGIDGQTALAKAIRNKSISIEIIKHLLIKGASPNIGDFLDVKPLNIAVALQKTEVVKLLLTNEANVDHMTQKFFEGQLNLIDYLVHVIMQVKLSTVPLLAQAFGELISEVSAGYIINDGFYKGTTILDYLVQHLHDPLLRPYTMQLLSKADSHDRVTKYKTTVGAMVCDLSNDCSNSFYNDNNEFIPVLISIFNREMGRNETVCDYELMCTKGLLATGKFADNDHQEL
jgi:hypothetical protein